MTDGGDPSTRTIEQLRMSSVHSKELSDAKFERLETQLKERDKAVELLQDRIDRQPTTDVLEQQIIALKDSVKVQFEALYKLMEAMAISNKESLSLALSSQQEAAKETKTSFNERFASLDDKVNDVKDRTLVLTNTDKTTKDTSASSRSMVAMIISAVGVIMAIAVGITIMTRGG